MGLGRKYKLLASDCVQHRRLYQSQLKVQRTPPARLSSVRGIPEHGCLIDE